MVEIDGMKLVQSRAILNYIASKYNLYGKDIKERALYGIFFCFPSTINRNSLDSSLNEQDCAKAQRQQWPWSYRLGSRTAENYENEGFHLTWNQASGMTEEHSVPGWSTWSDRGFQSLLNCEARRMVESWLQVPRHLG